ncbi:MAG: hypothetical protein EXR72_19800 [Myxococcales bacterium]|nr:hypothetical protein [Myxococcales bacterium]
MTAGIALALFAAAFLGCAGDRPLPYDPPDGSAGGDRKRPRTVAIRLAPRLKDQVDVLFMIDNSGSMWPMSDELRSRFGNLLKVFEDLAARGAYLDLQIGVVSSDYGSGSTGSAGCQPSPGGQQGKLIDLRAGAPNACQPPLGAGRFLKYRYGAGGKSSHNLPKGQSLLETFTCMASVGASGCGFEHPLESVYAALHNKLPENAGFVRDGALLAVVFITNEDDCSAPPDSDLFDKNKVDRYGFLSSYRCNRFGQVCGNPAMLLPYAASGKALANCGAAPNPGGAGPGKLYDITRYTDFFARPLAQGGVKANPLDVLLVGIDAPAEPVQVLLSNPSTPGKMPYASCAPFNDTSGTPCVPVIQHSCRNQQRTELFGAPAVRLNAVIRAAVNHRLSSICDDDYTPALIEIGQLIIANIGAACITEALPDPSNPVCFVEDVTTQANGSITIAEIARCADPKPSSYPCWRLEKKPLCSTSPQGLALTLDRNNQAAPASTETRASCVIE